MTLTSSTETAAGAIQYITLRVQTAAENFFFFWGKRPETLKTDKTVMPMSHSQNRKLLSLDHHHGQWSWQDPSRVLAHRFRQWWLQLFILLWGHSRSSNRYCNNFCRFRYGEYSVLCKDLIRQDSFPYICPYGGDVGFGANQWSSGMNPQWAWGSQARISWPLRRPTAVWASKF